MLALKVSISFTLSIMAGGIRLRQAQILECGNLAPLCHWETPQQGFKYPVPSLKTVTGHTTSKQ
jgi:hypothetical protein